MRNRVKLERVNSAAGAEVTTYTDHQLNVPANITPVGGTERLRGEQIEANVTHMIECRYTGDYVPSMRITDEYDSTVYHIQRIIKKDGRLRRYLILANEVVE